MIARCQHPSVRPAAGPAQPRPADRAAALRAGVLLAGRYRVTELLGSGATASVWRAHDVLLDRDVAVKRFHGRHSHGVAEARIAARVRHPNVAAVHDVITHDGSYGLVMDYYGRATLTALLRGGRRLPPRIVAALGLQLLAALQAVHAAGVVHCDVKPANLLLGDDGRLVLIDFGIAETGDEPAHPARRNGDVVGSPAYMAPEVVRGEAPGPPADLWSLGATLYTAVEGRPPFPPGDPVPTLAAVLHDPPAPTRRAARLQPLLTRLLAKDPAARPPHDAHPRTTHRRLPGRAGRRPRPPRRRRRSPAGRPLGGHPAVLDDPRGRGTDPVRPAARCAGQARPVDTRAAARIAWDRTDRRSSDRWQRRNQGPPRWPARSRWAAI